MADPNRALFESVVDLLRPLLGELVFVGGCTTGLLLTDSAAGGIRPTKDVDAIVDVTSYAKLVSEIGAAKPEVRAFIAGEIRTLLRAPDFVDAVPGFLLPDAASQARRALQEDRLRAIAALP